MKKKILVGDNLSHLRNQPDDQYRIIYLDPPFQSQRQYNMLSDDSGQVKAFNDTWTLGPDTENTFHELMDTYPSHADKINALKTLNNSSMTSYLIYMAIRLFECRRILNSNGSIYLHCDTTAGSALEMLMNIIFGQQNKRNQIIWCYDKWTNTANYFQKNHDIILFYTKTDNYVFNKQYQRGKTDVHERGWVENTYSHEGRRKKQLIIYKENDASKKKIEDKNYDNLVYRLDPEGVPISDWWNIPYLHHGSGERCDYPTQKPLELLERIILASSNENDWILDPFMGSGTTLVAAEKYNRNWVGMDLTTLATSKTIERLRVYHIVPDIQKQAIQLQNTHLEKYSIEGENQPSDIESAKKLAKKDPREFEIWAVLVAGGEPTSLNSDGTISRGVDGGIDGRINFTDTNSNIGYFEGIISVKSGNLKATMIDELLGVINRRNYAKMGVFISLHRPTPEMYKRSMDAGFYHHDDGKKYPVLQIITVEDIFDGKKINMPPNMMSKKHKKQQIKQSKRANENFEKLAETGLIEF